MVFGIQNSDFSTRIANLYGSQPSSAVFAFKTATLPPELLVSMGPSPHLWLLHAKQRLLDQNYYSLLVPTLICGFCIQNSDFSPRVASNYGSQPSSVVLCTHTSGIITRITSLYGSQPSSEVFACKTATFESELQVSMGPRHRLLICGCETEQIESE